ncbi:MAG: DUF1365 domain-containing protein [Deltaproteobacteria bacterium]|nr:DUF1365 domain-containing protein [Deltaproteobacteria bacterium]
MESCLYEGFVSHRRLRPVENRFRYRLFFVYLDLAELDRVFRGRWLWSVWAPNLAWLRREDHLGDPAVPLDEAVRALVAERLGRRPEGPVRLLAHLRYLGHNFNPVSFYYCFDPAGRAVEAVVAEIHNTPWGELFCYVVPGGEGGSHHARFPKAFHVSPFLPMELEYAWSFTDPGESLGVDMEDVGPEGTVFAAELRLARRPLTGPALARVLLQYPVVTVKVVAAIYWQALRLKLKGVPFYPHPDTGGARP